MPESRSSTGSRVGSLPSSWLGWASAVFVLLGVALVFVQAAQPWGLTAALLLALVTGVLALAVKKERSWMIWLAVGLPTLLLGFELAVAIVGGEH